MAAETAHHSSKDEKENEVLTFNFTKQKIAPGGHISLQDRFSRFKRDIVREKILAAEKSLPVERDANFRDALRGKFIEQAKSYIGTPYHAQYHGPDSQYFNAPLYLDCCGLVRRCLQDLITHFGFRIGRWNQNYQFDTLNESISNIESLRPGDLIFVEGRYFNPKSKRQKYDIVHVEVYLGDGKTIGARAQRGVVSIHDSYQYTSKLYEITNYHFRSLEPWLRGELCPAHPSHWDDKDSQPAGSVAVSGDRSIFNHECSADAEELSA